MQWFTLCGFLFATRRVRKVIRFVVALTLRTLIYVDPFKVHFQYRNRCIPKENQPQSMNIERESAVSHQLTLDTQYV